MAAETDVIVLSVRRPRGDDETLTEIGKVSFGERGVLILLSAQPAFQTVLENIVSAINALPELRIKAPPPPEAEPHSLFRRSVQRDDPELLLALSDYLEQKYNLFITPE